MAKPTNKRRGISLGPRADTAAPLDQMTFQTGEFPAGPAPAAMPELLTELRRMNADLESRWQYQEQQLQQQQQHLEQQRDQLTLQTRQLQSLEHARRSKARLSVLLTTLVLVGVSALAFHAWPRLQEFAGNVNQVSANANQITPEIQALHLQLTYLGSGLGEMDSTIATLRDEISAVRSDLGSLGKAVNKAPPNGVGAGSDSDGSARQVAHTLARETTSIRDPYRRMHPMRPW